MCHQKGNLFGLFNSTQRSYTATSCKQLHDAFGGETPAMNNQDLVLDSWNWATELNSVNQSKPERIHNPGAHNMRLQLCVNSVQPACLWIQTWSCLPAHISIEKRENTVGSLQLKLVVKRRLLPLDAALLVCSPNTGARWGFLRHSELEACRSERHSAAKQWLLSLLMCQAGLLCCKHSRGIMM